MLTKCWRVCNGILKRDARMCLSPTMRSKLFTGKPMSLQLKSMPQEDEHHAPASTYVLGVRVDQLTQGQALDVIEQLILSRRTSGNSLPCQQVITVNTEFVMMAQQDSAFRDAINTAALVVADGIGIVWATHLGKEPAPERVTGTDTLIALAQRCAASGYRLYLLGAAPGVAEKAAAYLQKIAPGLSITGTYAGSPAQELWIYRNLARLPVAVAMGVGGAYDFLSGRQRRAPRVMQRLGLEWLYRLYREPWRWKRMLAIPRFMIGVLFRRRKNERSNGR